MSPFLDLVVTKLLKPREFTLTLPPAIGIYYGIYQLQGETKPMKTARLFMNGRSQAVRLPKECRFEGTDVYVKQFQGLVILFSKDAPWSSLFNSLDHFTDDFMSDREQPPQHEREDR
jgi:antitoxin VapB